MSVRENIANHILTTIQSISSPAIKKATRQPFPLDELSEQQYPAVLIQTQLETKEDQELGSGGKTRINTLEFLITGYTKGAESNIDTSRNELAEAIENKLEEDISNLRNALATGTQTQYRDRETGQIITTTSSSARRAYERQLEQAITNRDKISPKIEALNDSITNLEIQVLDMETQNEETNELGVIQSVSEITGWSLQFVANIFILILIIVFDPLAISLVLATNQAFKNAKPKKNMYGEIKQEPKIQPTIMVQPNNPPVNQPTIPDAQVELEKQMNE